MENEIRTIGKLYSLVEGLIEVLNTPNDNANCLGCGRPYTADNNDCSNIDCVVHKAIDESYWIKTAYNLELHREVGTNVGEGNVFAVPSKCADYPASTYIK